MPASPSVSPNFGLLDSLWRDRPGRGVLPNGLTWIVKPDTSAALASVQVWVKTGSIHEGQHLGAGLSHFLEHMLFKGTERRAGREISATVQAHGGYINAYTTFDRTVYHIDLPSEHMDVAVDILADAVLHSTVDPGEVARERDVILREIAMTHDDPDSRLWEALFSTAFREHPYRQPIIGHRDIFAAVTRDDLYGYYRTRYVPENMVVVIVGDVETAAARASVELHFGAVPRSRLAPAPVAAEPPQLAPRENHRYEDVELTRAVLSWPVPGLAHPDAPVLDLLAIILGNGDSSVLWSEVREKAGLVHAIHASSWVPGTSGLFCVAITCEPAKRVAAMEAVERVLAGRAARGFTAAQLAKALRQLVVGELNTRKTMSGQASRLGVAEVVVGDLDFSKVYFQRLRSVGTADLRRALKAYLVPACRTAVSINPVGSGPSAAPGSGRSGPREAPSFSESRLANGARLLLRPDPRLPSLHMRLLMNGGPLFEKPGLRGSTALLGTMLTKDTRRRSAAEVARYVEEIGGSFYPFSGNNSLGLCAEVLSPDVGRAISVIGDAILSPVFKAATFAKERDAQLASLKEDDDDVVTFSRKLLRRKFFGAHPLALDAHGDLAGVGALSPGDLSELIGELGRASNIVLAVSGDFEPDRLGPRLEALLSRLPRGKAGTPAAVDPAVLPGFPGDHLEIRQREQAVVLQAYPGPGIQAPDRYAGEVADELFSGMASRLFERVREEKGLAYFVRSERVIGLDAGMFSFIAGTQPGKEKVVQAEIDAEIERVQSGSVEEAELRRCRERLKVAWRQQSQTNSARTFRAGLDVLHGLPANDGDKYDARIDAVTAGDVQEFAVRYFQASRRVRLVVREDGVRP